MIRKLREAKKLTLRQVAKTVDLPISILSDMERGRRNWTEVKFFAVEKAIQSLR
jgi:cytoskeletal protein RodZ